MDTDGYSEDGYSDEERTRPYFDESRENVATDSEIKRLIEELVPMVNEWLEKHP